MIHWTLIIFWLIILEKLEISSLEPAVLGEKSKTFLQTGPKFDWNKTYPELISSHQAVGIVSDFYWKWQSFGHSVQTLFQWEENLSKNFQIQTKTVFLCYAKIDSAHLTISHFWKVAWFMTCFFHGTQLKGVNKWSELLWISLVKKQLWRTDIRVAKVVTVHDNLLTQWRPI